MTMFKEIQVGYEAAVGYDTPNHSSPYGPITQIQIEPILERQARLESNARTYARKLHLALKSAKGVWLEATDGRTYMDCLAGAGTLALGHNHPRVIQALQEALSSNLPLHTLDLATAAKDQFVTRLFSFLPNYLQQRGKIQFCSPSGADAVEAALKLAKTVTGRSHIIAFTGAYHGMTAGAMGITASMAMLPETAPQDVTFMPFPNSLHCPFGTDDKNGETAARYFEFCLKAQATGIKKPAAVIIEAVQGEGGAIAAPPHFLQEVRRITRELDIPLILDEVQAGMGRTGKMFAFEHSDIEPDVIVLSKALGGSLPLAVIVYRQELDLWGCGAHTGTFRGNQLAMVAGEMSMRILQEEQILESVQRVGQRLLTHCTTIGAGFSEVAQVRGLGLMIGMELCDFGAKRDIRHISAPHPKFARLVQQKCLEQGLIVEIGGPYDSVIRLLPPLNITPKECDLIAEKLERGMIQARAAL